jgi:predicted XRE-type DNA-binding protein
MKKDDLELLRGSGNVYRDFGRPNADLEQARAITAAKIIRILDERELSTRDAEKLTGVSYSEFSRIRNTQLGRFTLDRMIAILGKLDKNIEVSVTFRARKPRAAGIQRVASPMVPHGISRRREARRTSKA